MHLFLETKHWIMLCHHGFLSTDEEFIHTYTSCMLCHFTIENGCSSDVVIFHREDCCDDCMFLPHLLVEIFVVDATLIDQNDTIVCEISLSTHECLTPRIFALHK